MKNLLTLACLLIALSPLMGETEIPQKVASRLGENGISILKSATSGVAYPAGGFYKPQKHGPNPEQKVVGQRFVTEEGMVTLTEEQVEAFKGIFLTESTWTSQDSKGTVAAAAIILKNEAGQSLEASYCVRKGNFVVLAKSPEGTPIKLGKGRAAGGGFKTDKDNPIRPLTAAIFPDNADFAAYAK